MGGGGAEASKWESGKRKSSRKQRSPKFLDSTGSSKKSSNECSSDDLRRENKNLSNTNNRLASSGDNSLNQRRKERDSKSAREFGIGVEGEEEEEVDLKEYSKTVVTVMDSSIQGWRSEMFVFRKSNNVWRVREKKSKSRSSMSIRGKRKLVKSNSSDKDDDDADSDNEKRKRKKKKKIMRVSDSAPGSLSRNGNGKEDAVVPLLNEGQFSDDNVEKPLDRVALLRGEAPIKSFPYSSSHWKLKGEASSVILVRFDTSGSLVRDPGKTNLNI